MVGLSCCVHHPHRHRHRPLVLDRRCFFHRGRFASIIGRQYGAVPLRFREYLGRSRHAPRTLHVKQCILPIGVHFRQEQSIHATQGTLAFRAQRRHHVIIYRCVLIFGG